MATPMSVAGIVAAFSAGTLTSVTPISDTASHVDANFDALQAVATAGLLGSISLINGGRGTIAITSAQVTSDAGVLGLINKPYFLAQRTTAAQAAGVVLAAPFRAIAIVDTAANIAANLPAIQAIYTTGYLGDVRMTDTGMPVYSLSAAQVSANADALHNISSPYTIKLTDAGTPTITLPVWDTQTAVYTNLVARITTPFNLAFNGVIRPASVASIEIGVDHYTNSNVSGLPANPIAPLGNATATLLPSGLQVLDFESRLSSTIDSLQIAAQAGKLASVTQRDGGVQVLSVTPAQATNDSLALSLFSANTQLSQIITAAQAAAPPTLDSRFFSFTVQDSLANVLANIGAIDALAQSGQMSRLRITETAPDLQLTAAQLAQDAYALSFASEESMTITLTDAGTPTITISGDLLNVFNVRNNILNHITGSFNLVVTGVINASVASSIVSENNKVLASLTSVRVADFSNNIASNLSALQTLAVANKLTAIDLVGGGVPTLGLSSATATADTQALGKISSPVITTSATSSPVSLTPAAFTAALATPTPTLEQKALAGTLGTITLTGGGTPVLSTSAANLAANMEAYGKISGAYTISLTDGGVPALVLNHWQITGASIAVLSKISGSFTFSISGALSAGQAVPLANSSAVLPKLTGKVDITDFGNNISNNNPNNLPALTVLSQAGHLGSITLFDGGTRFPLTVAQATDNATALNAITSPYTLTEAVSAAIAADTAVPSNRFISLDVVDTVANVVVNLDALEPLAASGKITALNFSGPPPFAMTISAATLGADADALRLASLSNTFSIALTDAGTPTITLRDWQIPANNNIPTLLSRITTPYTLAINGPIRTNTAAALANFGTAFVDKIANKSLIIRDPALNFQVFTDFMPQLLTLANAGKIASIDMRTGGVPVFPISAADRVTYAPVFNLITTPYLQAQLVTVAGLTGNSVPASGFTTFAVRDTVANVLNALPQLEALAAAGKLAELFFTDTVPRIVTSSSNIASAADVWAVEDNSSYPFVFTDSGTPVITLPSYQFTYAMRNDVLDSIVGPWNLRISGNAAPATLAIIAEENNGVLAHLAGGITAAAYSFNIQPYLDQLEFLTKAGKIDSINMIDGGSPKLTISGQQATADIDAINKIVSSAVAIVAVNDSAANVVADLDQLQSLATQGKLASITLTDTSIPVLTVTAAQGTNDALALKAITSPHSIVVSGASDSGLVNSLIPDQQLELIYVAYFNRAADAGGDNFWNGQNVQAQNAGQSAAAALTNIANSFEPQAETIALYPFLGAGSIDLTSPAAQAGLGTFVNSVFSNLFNRASDSAGKDYWVSQITSGTVGLGAAALAIANGATGSDATVLGNRVTVALDFTTQTAAAGLGVTGPLPAGFLAAASTVLSAVDGTSLNDASVITGENATKAYVSGATTSHQTTATSLASSATGPVDPNVITITDPDQLVDPGAGSHTIQFLAAASGTVVLHSDGTDLIIGFDPGTDVLDLHPLVQNVDLNSVISALGNYLTVTEQGADALLSFDPTGHNGGTTIAVLQGLGAVLTGPEALTAQGAIRIA